MSSSRTGNLYPTRASLCDAFLFGLCGCIEFGKQRWQATLNSQIMFMQVYLPTDCVTNVKLSSSARFLLLYIHYLISQSMFLWSFLLKLTALLCYMWCYRILLWKSPSKLFLNNGLWWSDLCIQLNTVHTHFYAL